MHYTLEILIPPMDHNDIEDYLNDTLIKYREYDENDNRNFYGFYDYFRIGGRYSGRKMENMLDPDKLEEFYKELKDRSVTVSSLVWGKQSLSPESQIPMVDDLWKEFFPEWQGDNCPLFSHSTSNDFSDIMTLGECKKYEGIMNMKMCSFAVAKNVETMDSMGVKFLLHSEIWNGNTHQKTDFGGTLQDGIKEFEKDFERATDEYKEKVKISDDWLVVTVDYHS